MKMIPFNYIGYDMIMNNINCGIGEDEFKKIFFDFISKRYTADEIKYIKDRLTFDMFMTSCTTFDDTLQYIEKILENMCLS
jgi:hypothetical protein